MEISVELTYREQRWVITVDEKKYTAIEWHRLSQGFVELRIFDPDTGEDVDSELFDEIKKQIDIVEST